MHSGAWGRGATTRATPPHAPVMATGRSTLLLLPGIVLYFDVGRKVYFYMEGSEWKTAASLPDSIRVKLGNHVTIEMDDDQPYRQFRNPTRSNTRRTGEEDERRWRKREER